MFSELDVAGSGKERYMREQSLGLDLNFGDGIQIQDDEGDIRMGDDFNFNIGDQSTVPAGLPGPGVGRARIRVAPVGCRGGVRPRGLRKIQASTDDGYV